MSQNFVFSGANNTYIPTFSPEASNALIVSYARDPKRFAVNRYSQVVKVDHQNGKYIRLNAYDASRVLDTSGADIVWADGADRPINTDQGFEYPAFSTVRRSLGFHIGDLAAEQAAWDIVAAKAQTAASRMMTYQTASAVAALTGGALPTATATALGGGKWNAGNNATASQAYFRIGVQAVLSTIQTATNSVVNPDEILAIMNPNTARKLNASLEVMDTVKQMSSSVEFLGGNGVFSGYGLPQRLFGVGEVIVESSVLTSTKPNAAGTGTQSFIVPDGVVIFVSRPGGIEGSMGSFSTLQGFFKEEMTVETWSDPVNRRQIGSVTSDWDYQVAAPVSGFYVTAAI